MGDEARLPHARDAVLMCVCMHVRVHACAHAQVDAPVEEQELKLHLWEDDIGADTKLGVGVLRFNKDGNMYDPRKPDRVFQLGVSQSAHACMHAFKEARRPASWHTRQGVKLAGAELRVPCGEAHLSGIGRCMQPPAWGVEAA